MAKTTAQDKQDKQETPVKTRKVTTVADRIAAAEQKLRDLRAKANEKNAKRIEAIDEEVEKLDKQIAERSAKKAELVAEKETLEAQPDDADPIARANDRASAPAEVDGVDSDEGTEPTDENSV